MIFHTSNDTQAWGEALGACLVPGDVILLEGDLGAGKTTLTQGIARGLGVQETVTSPTFVTVSAYDSGRLPLYHMDVYRITSEDALYDIGLEEMLYGDGVCVVEWPSLLGPLYPDDALVLTLSDPGDGTRRLTAETIGACDILSRKECSQDVHHSP